MIMTTAMRMTTAMSRWCDEDDEGDEDEEGKDERNDDNEDENEYFSWSWSGAVMNVT